MWCSSGWCSMPYSCIGSCLSSVVVDPCYSRVRRLLFMFICYHRTSCDALVNMWVPWSYSYAPGFAKLISDVRARAMMINRGWSKCAFEQSRHLWVSSWILPLVSRILFDHVILIVLSLDGRSSWVITRAASLYKQINLVKRNDGGRLYDRGKMNLSPLSNEPWTIFLNLKVSFIYAPVVIPILCKYFFSLIPLFHIKVLLSGARLIWSLLSHIITCQIGRMVD